MTEKSIMPLNSYSAYTPPFQYTALIDLQVHFSKFFQNRFAARKMNASQREDTQNNSFSVETGSQDQIKYSKKPVHQKEFIFGADYDEMPNNRTTMVSKLKHRKGLSSIETPIRPSLDIPDLLISKSPSKAIKRFISPYIRDTRGTPKSVKEIRKTPKNKKKKLPSLTEDETLTSKEFIFDYFLKILRSSNGIHTRTSPLKTYKFYVGPGNNSDLVAKIIKTRPWFIRCESYKEAHFVWTSVKHKKISARLPPGSYVEQVLMPLSKRLPMKKFAESEKMGFNFIASSNFFCNLNASTSIDMQSLKLHNRLEFNKHLTSKKRLFANLKKFYLGKGLDPFDFIPVTFHIKGPGDENFMVFKEKFLEILEKTGEKLWIVKPGENTNRGNGIKVCNSIESISEVIRSQKEGRTYIIQKYIERPLLMRKRKFDIRCFALITSINNNIQGYFYPEGYIRTSCKEFSTKSFNRFIHLTNDAVQKNSEEYGKFEPGNKISYCDFQNYLNAEYPSHKVNFEKNINQQIRSIVSDTIQASYSIIDPHRKLHSFELLGYDFMVDQQFKVWLIEVNTNPCLELSCGYLSKLIPAVIDNTFRITLDQLFCPTSDAKKFKKWIPDGVISNKFELIFSEWKLK
jgi:hypothetical protein